ncbi:hypothetical protein Mgra_00009633 [Meloidogyne graminicola]|uniref:EGF-like domain-containing protein n=1 Tax=Meloidogyne graminicola TaxID=189291 RepID=A0A8S9ZD12_9BILA|nr:hypothetical protein Mgra_00009633 [Meloidogyne graminicola]
MEYVKIFGEVIGFIGIYCQLPNPCYLNNLNQTIHNCVHGRCVRPRIVLGVDGNEFATNDCDCFAGYTGDLCMRLIEIQQPILFNRFISLIVIIIILCIAFGILLNLFIVCTGKKRANQGTYSPSNQEMTGNARFFNNKNNQKYITKNNKTTKK